MPQAFTQDLYATIEARLKDWLNAGGGNVANIALDLLNRAQARLWNACDWDELMKKATLTLVGNVATLPTDFGREIRVYADITSTGMPYFMFYAGGSLTNGYRKNDAFAKGTGHVVTFNFYYTPALGPIVCDYMQVLTDFVGSGTEYSYFSGELLLRCAQLIHSEEMPAEITNGDMQAIEKSYLRQLQEYKRGHYGVNRPTYRQITDSRGGNITLDDMNAGGSTTQRRSDLSRDTDFTEQWNV